LDYNQPDELRLDLLQGDTRQAGDPSDGAVARRQIAQVLVRSLGSDAAVRKTFELVAELGPAPEDFNVLFAPLQADLPGSLDGAQDLENMPLTDEPQQVRDDPRRNVCHGRGACSSECVAHRPARLFEGLGGCSGPIKTAGSILISLGLTCGLIRVSSAVSAVDYQASVQARPSPTERV
jgi:hypothetical protein